MSMHEIEGLIEDSVLLLNESKKTTQEKRELFFNLYRFQQMFDTGYTHFRVAEILRQNNFLLSIPLVDHPSYANRKEEIAKVEKAIEEHGDTWLDDGLCMKDESSDSLVVYYDYGSELWQTLVDNKKLDDTAISPKVLSVPELTHVMITEATHQSDDLLTLEWYVMMTNCFVEEYVDYSEYQNFTDFINDEKITEAKALALSAGIQDYDEEDGYLTFQEWNDEVDLIDKNNIDKQFIVRYLLDLNVTKEECQKAYSSEIDSQKKLNKNNNKDKKIDLIRDQLEPFLNENNGWILASTTDNEKETVWVWFKDNPKIKHDEIIGFDDDFYRQLIKVEFNKMDHGIHCDVGLQFGKILRWQKQVPDFNPVYWHFKSHLLVNFDFDDPHQDKLINSWGLWKYPLSRSNKKLKETLSIFRQYLEKEVDNIHQKALLEFSDTLWTRDCDKLIDVIENGEEGTDGVIPDYIIFDLAAMIPMVFLFNAIDNVPANEDISEDKNVKKYFAKFKKAVDSLHPKGVSKLYLAQRCSLDELIECKMPYIIQAEFIANYRSIIDNIALEDDQN